MRNQRHNNRRGVVAVLMAILLIPLVAMVAFSVDIGYICVADSELQRCSDAAAIAGASELLEQRLDDIVVTSATGPVFESANLFASKNLVAGDSPQLASTDVEVGYIADPSDPASTMVFDNPSRNNAVRVRVQRTDVQNGAVPLFFASVLGVDKTQLSGEATAAFVDSIRGFRSTHDGRNLDLLPFALDIDTWNAMWDNGVGEDKWAWDEESQQVFSGSDGALEINLFPQGTGSPGNRGTVDIGSSNNSTNDIARQILYGISDSDLAYHGGKLEFDTNGEIVLNGDTGISAGVKDELASIIGDRRIIPLFQSVSGNGNNADYVITDFACIRIVEVKLTGKQTKKRVMIQPAEMVTFGGIPDPGASASTGIFSPVWLTR